MRKVWQRPDAPLVLEGRLYVNAIHGNVALLGESGEIELDEALRKWLCSEWVVGLLGPDVRVTMEYIEPETYA